MLETEPITTNAPANLRGTEHGAFHIATIDRRSPSPTDVAQQPLRNVAFTLVGHGGVVVLVHGLGGGTYELQRLGEHLHDALGFTVRAIHLPGHEQPSRLMPASRHEDWVAAVHAAIDAAVDAEGADGADGAVHVVGFSTGALTALRVAEQRTWRGSLVLLAPLVRVYRPPLLPVPTERVLSWLPGLTQVPRRPPPLRDRALRGEVTRVLPFFTMSLEATRSALALSATTMQHLDRVEVPTLVVQGAGDTVVDPAGAREIDAGLRCRKELVVLERSDHLIALDVDHAAAFAAVTRFIAPV